MPARTGIACTLPVRTFCAPTVFTATCQVVSRSHCGTLLPICWFDRLDVRDIRGIRGEPGTERSTSQRSSSPSPPKISSIEKEVSPKWVCIWVRDPRAHRRYTTPSRVELLEDDRELAEPDLLEARVAGLLLALLPREDSRPRLFERLESAPVFSSKISRRRCCSRPRRSSSTALVAIATSTYGCRQQNTH